MRAFLASVVAVSAGFGLLGSVAAAKSSAVHYKYCVGVVLKLEPQAEDANRYTITRQKGGDWVPYGTATFDEMRRLVSQEVTGHGTLSFDPHNCEKTVGLCTYTETGFDGESIEKLRINGREGDEWNYSVMTSETQELLMIGTVTYGADGLADRDEWTELDSTRSGCFERIPPPESEG